MESEDVREADEGGSSAGTVGNHIDESKKKLDKCPETSAVLGAGESSPQDVKESQDVGTPEVAGTSAEDKSDSCSSSSSTLIKKRSSSHNHRNYRSSLENVAAEDDSDNDVNASDALCEMCEQSSTKKRRSNDDDRNPDERGGGDAEIVMEDENLNDWTMAIGRTSPPHDEDNHDSDSEDDEQAEGEENQRRPHVSDSESSSGSLPSLHTPSSESSDCVLEDLDEEVPERSTGNQSTSGTSAKKKPNRKQHETPKVLLKPRPAYNWAGPSELFKRELGYRASQQPQTAEIFRSKFYGSLYSVERLELMRKLDNHEGCVNCLNFNSVGTKLASGSDDLHIKIWNFASGKELASFHSGHRANVFQVKFIPLVGMEDTRIVSCARDNQVRLSELKNDGKVWYTRKLAQHRGPAHKLSVSPETPHVVLSAGEDGVVFSIDIREDKFSKILQVREQNRRVQLYSIHQNPLNSFEFCVSGRDEYVRIYDTRKLSSSSASVSQDNRDVENSESNINAAPLKKFCPHHLVDNRHKPNITAAVYNYNGREIVASYNDENIYLFDATHSDGADYIKQYEGHRNNATIKGINFFGDKSQFIVSGSDCGHVFLWDKETESIVNFFRGDENGVVNCLEPHPTSPILATSGLDNDVKIWIPSKESDPRLGPGNRDLSLTVYKNLKEREDSLGMQPEAMDGRIIQALWYHIRRANRQRRRGEGTSSDSDDTDDSEPEEDDDLGDSHSHGVECSVM